MQSLNVEELARIWASERLALFLNYISQQMEKRKKICPFCKVLFFDNTTKNANRVYCGKVKCLRLYNAERARNSYNNLCKLS